MNRKCLESMKEDIIASYLLGRPSTIIGKKYNISSRTIRRNLAQWGISLRSISESKFLARSSFKYSCDDLFFNNVSGANSYWAGFIAADGYVGLQNRKNGRRYLSLEISQKDISHLQRFKEDLNSTHPILSTVKNCCKIKIFSNVLTDALRDNFNIVNAKTFTYVPPMLSWQHMRHFIRGYIDGDGCVKLPKDRCAAIEIKGTYETCLTFRDLLSQHCETNPNLAIGKASGCRTIVFSGKQCFRISTELCRDTNLFLNRKWSKLLCTSWHL